MSLSRYCEFWRAADGKWYMDLANSGYHDEDDDEEGGRYGDGEYEDSTTYGPFNNGKSAYTYLSNFSNPGAYSVDNSGTRPPPTKSPNGSKVQSPQHGSVGGRYYGGDKPHWDAEMEAEFADPQTKPVTQPTPAAVPAAAPKPAPKPTPAPSQSGKKSTYKIYGAHHDVNKGSSDVHTRVKGRVYAPTKPSRFKKGQSARVTVGGDEAEVADPTSGHSQVWSKKEVLQRFVREVLQELTKTKT